MRQNEMADNVVILSDYRTSSLWAQSDDAWISAVDMEDAKNKFLLCLEALIDHANRSLAIIDNGIVKTSLLSFDRLHRAISELPASSPHAPEVYKNAAIIIQELGKILADELRHQLEPRSP